MSDAAIHVSDDIDLDPARSMPSEWYQRRVVDVARDLLGCLIVSTAEGKIVAGRIVETEAYDGEDDPACHSAFRRNGVVQAMWGPRGTLYVYLAYGMYPCFNVVAGPDKRPSAVLIRAVEPAVNVGVMAARTGRAEGPKVASGPGLTGRAMGINLQNNGHRLQESPIWIEPAADQFEIAAGPRIGIKRGVEHEWRFGIAGHRSLSKRFD